MLDMASSIQPVVFDKKRKYPSHKDSIFLLLLLLESNSTVSK